MGIDRSLFVEEVPSDCICCICQEVLDDPKETLTCQHAFCHSCITRWLHDRNSCPSCRCPLSVNDLVSLHRIWRDKLHHLRVRCHNCHIGCDVIVELQQLDYHYDTCPYMRVTCPHSPCSVMVLRSILPRHLELCDYRKIRCVNCQLSVPAVSLKEHECIPALREDMQQKIEMLKREFSDHIRMMHREQRKLEGKLQEQAHEIDELRDAITLLTTQRRPTTLPQLPAISVTGSAVRVNAHASAATVTGTRSTHTNRRPHDTRGTINLSLPRLAPLHTHMSLSRNSEGYSDGPRSHHSRPDSVANNNPPN